LAPDITKKLQKLERFEGKLLSKLVERAQYVYNNRDTPEDRQAKRLSKVMVAALPIPTFRPLRSSGPPANQQLRRNPRAPLEKDEYAYCKKKGHWKNECPKKKGWAETPYTSYKLPFPSRKRKLIWTPKSNLLSNCC
jgi:hypothetical protein